MVFSRLLLTQALQNSAAFTSSALCLAVSLALFQTVKSSIIYMIPWALTSHYDIYVDTVTLACGDTWVKDSLPSFVNHII